MLTRKEKEEIVVKLSEEIKQAPACVLVDFKGLGANDMVALKRKLRESESTFQVIKKKLLAIALKNNDIDLDPRSLEGQIAISVSSDEITSAKIIYETTKENDNIKIVGGILDGQMMDAPKIQALAKLPTNDELRAQFVGQLLAPIRGLVGVFSGVPRSFVYTLSAIKDSKES